MNHQAMIPIAPAQLDAAAIVAALKKTTVAGFFREVVAENLPRYAVDFRPHEGRMIRFEISDETLRAAWDVAGKNGRTAQDALAMACDFAVTVEANEMRAARPEDFEIVDSHHRVLKYTARVTPGDLDGASVARYNTLFSGLTTLDGISLGIAMPHNRHATPDTSAEVARQAEAQQRAEAARSAERERERQEQARHDARLAEILL